MCGLIGKIEAIFLYISIGVLIIDNKYKKYLLILGIIIILEDLRKVIKWLI